MTTVKRKRRRRVNPKMPLGLAERIVQAGEVIEEPEKEVGPLGNFDYVPYGSEAHATLLGFDPADGETVFDLTGIEEKDAARFLSQRRRMLKTVPTIPVGCPPPWNPDA